MLYIKDGYPEVNEIVICTVSKIYGNTTFVELNEYEKEGVLTIAEIAPGRIRNLRDHVVENKVIVCKVLRVDEKQGRIDVSLRRVPIPVMKEKTEEVKREEFAEKAFIDISKELKITKDELFEKTYADIFDNYNTVFEALYDIMLDNIKVSILKNLDKKEKEVFVKIINDKIKPEEIVLKKKFHLSSLAENGSILIRDSIDIAIKATEYNKIDVTYLAAGEFLAIIMHDDMKSADKVWNKFNDNLQKEVKINNLDYKQNG